MKQVTMFLIAPLIAMVSLSNHWTPAFAQWSTDPNINNTISTAVSRQEFPSITSDGAGGAIITWEDRSIVFPYYSDIYAQRIDSSGVLRWDTNGVAISTAFSDQSVPSILSDGTGGAIIAWEDYRNASITGIDINAQRVNASGVVQWDTNGVEISTGYGSQRRHTIASDGTGGAIITWDDDRSGTAHIYAQRVAPLGFVQWTPNGIEIFAMSSYFQIYPTIVSDDAGGAIITWGDARNPFTTGNDIYAQRVNSTGSLLWGAASVAISLAANTQEFPTIASDGAGGAIITWQDSRSDVNYDIYAQRIGASGAVQWDSNGVAISTTIGYQVSPTIISDGTGGAIITWQDLRGTSFDIYAQRVAPSGAMVWSSNGVALCTASGDQTSPTIISDGAGGAIVSWQDRGGVTELDIYAQRINGAGNVLWSTNGVAVSVAGGDQKFHEIIRGAGGFIITWEDFRSGNFDIYAQQVSANGNLGEITDVVEGSILPSSFRLHQNYPNPFNPSTKISFEVPVVSYVSLRVFDLLGREVATLVNERLNPGSYEASFASGGLSSGVYFYRLSAMPTTGRDLVLKDGQTSTFTETKKLVLVR